MGRPFVRPGAGANIRSDVRTTLRSANLFVVNMIAVR